MFCASSTSFTQLASNRCDMFVAISMEDGESWFCPRTAHTYRLICDYIQFIKITFDGNCAIGGMRRRGNFPPPIGEFLHLFQIL